MRERERPGDTKLSTKKKLIKRLIIIMLKVDYGEDKGDDEEINITRLYRSQRGEVGEEI